MPFMPAGQGKAKEGRIIGGKGKSRTGLAKEAESIKAVHWTRLDSCGSAGLTRAMMG